MLHPYDSFFSLLHQLTSNEPLDDGYPDIPFRIIFEGPEAGADFTAVLLFAEAQGLTLFEDKLPLKCSAAKERENMSFHSHGLSHGFGIYQRQPGNTLTRDEDLPGPSFLCDRIIQDGMIDTLVKRLHWRQHKREAIRREN